MQSLIKNKKGQTGVIMLFASLSILFAVGFAIDFYRIEVDKQELARATDIVALGIASTASLNDDVCVIQQANIDATSTELWNYNKKNRHWEFDVVSTLIQKQNGIVKVESLSYLPLYFTSRIWGNRTGGYYVINAISEVKCTPN